MGGEIEVGVFEVPDIVGDYEPDGHIGPEHIGLALILGGEEVDAARHAEYVDEARERVQYVPPAAVKEHALIGGPPRAGKVAGDLERGKRGFEIGNVRDHYIRGDDEPGEPLEPFFLAYAPFILDHHEADAADRRGIELKVMEPAVHIGDGGIFLSPEEPDVREDVIDRQRKRNGDEYQYPAELAFAADLIEQDQPRKHQAPPQYLPQICYLKYHDTLPDA